jgi:hypothetical protein
MITYETIQDTINEYLVKNGKSPKYVLVDRLSLNYISRTLRPKEKVSLGPINKDAKISAVGTTKGTVLLMAVESDDEFIEAVS